MIKKESRKVDHTRESPKVHPKLTKLSPKESHRRFTARSRIKAKHDSDEPDEDCESEEYTIDFMLEENTHHLDKR
jgi:hypothetical protein